MSRRFKIIVVATCFLLSADVLIGWMVGIYQAYVMNSLAEDTDADLKRMMDEMNRSSTPSKKPSFEDINLRF